MANQIDAPPELPVDKRQADRGAGFFRAVKQGDLQRVMEFIRNNFDISSTNSSGLNGLHLAAKEGNVPIAVELLKAGIDPNAVTKKGNTALHIASLAGHFELVRVLVQQFGANPNARSEKGFTPLYCAAQENHADVVKFLLSVKADPWLATDDNFTPFAVALQQGNEDIVQLLTDQDTRTNKAGMMPLHVAAKHDDEHAAQLIITRGSQLNESVNQSDVINMQSQGGIGFTAMHLASQYGSLRVAQLLFDRGANVNFKAKNDITPLHVAAKWGKLDMVKFLTERDAFIDSVTKDLLTPLHCAARSGHVNIVEYCLDRGANINAKTKNGLTPLIMCGQGDHLDCGRLLLNRGALIDDATIDKLTALHVSAHCGSLRMCKMLLDRKCDANARAMNGFTALHVAAKKNRPKVVDLLLKYGALVDASTDSGLTPLLVAVFMGHQTVAQTLLAHNANPHAATSRGETALHIAARAAQLDIVRLLIRRGCDVNARAREQQTPLHIAARLGQAEIVQALLQAGALVDAQTSDNYTSLHICAKEGHEDVAHVLLEFGARVDMPTKKGFTPLHLCAKYGRVGVAKLLLAKRTNPDMAGNNAITPLHVAVHFGQVDVARLLIDARANVHAAARNGYTPLHIAAKKGLKDCAALLLNAGAKSLAESKTGFTPIHLAALEGHAELVDLLIKARADPNSKARNGLRPMHLAAQEDRVPVARVLQQWRAELDQPTRAGYTPLHTACHFGQLNMIRFLLDNGVNVNALTKQQYTPLCLAAQQGHAPVVRLLLASGANPNQLTETDQSALSIAQQLGYVEVAQLLTGQTTVQAATPVGTLIRVHPEIMNDENESDEAVGEQENYQPTLRYTTSTLRSRNDRDYETDSVFYDMMRPGAPDRVRKSHQDLDIADQLREEMEYTRTGGDDTRSTAYSTFEFGTLRHESAGSGDPIWSIPDQRNEQPFVRTPNNTIELEPPVGITAKDDAETSSMLQPRQQQQEIVAPTVVVPVLSQQVVNAVESTPANEVEESISPASRKQQQSAAHGLQPLTNGHQREQEATEPTIASTAAYIEAQQAAPASTRPELEEPAPAPAPSPPPPEPVEPEVEPEPVPERITLADLNARSADNAIVDRTPSSGGFLVSFLVDARGGIMRGTRYAGLRFVIPPKAVSQPTRITCRLLRKDRMTHMPPLGAGEGLATRALEMGPIGLHFARPILIEVPHFAALRDGDREIIAIRSENGEAWRDHTPVADDDSVREALRLPEAYAPIDFDGVNVLRERNAHALLFSELPMYIALVSRFRTDSKLIDVGSAPPGSTGDFIAASRSTHTQIIFPPACLQKRTRIHLQMTPVHPDLVRKYFGSGLGANASPIVTIEPRRRKFHQPIHVAIPFPRNVNDNELTATSTIRLLCSLTNVTAGGTAPVGWDDITPTTQMQVVKNNIITFTSTVSARFWIVEVPTTLFTTNRKAGSPDIGLPVLTEDGLSTVHALYQEVIAVPYLVKFIVFGKRLSENEARLRCMCITDERIEYSLEVQEKFLELARSKEIEVLDQTRHRVEMTGNLVALPQFDENGAQTHVINLPFSAFSVNRAQFEVTLDDSQSEEKGRLVVLRDLYHFVNPVKFRSPKRSAVEQQPILEAVLDVELPHLGAAPPLGLHTSASLRSQEFLSRIGLSQQNLNTLPLTGVDIDIDEYDKKVRAFCKQLGYDWNFLARELSLTRSEMETIRQRFHTNEDRSAQMFSIWSTRLNSDGDLMLQSLRRVGRSDLANTYYSLFASSGPKSATLNGSSRLINGGSVPKLTKSVDFLNRDTTHNSLSVTLPKSTSQVIPTGMTISPTDISISDEHLDAVASDKKKAIDFASFQLPPHQPTVFKLPSEEPDLIQTKSSRAGSKTQIASRPEADEATRKQDLDALASALSALEANPPISFDKQAQDDLSAGDQQVAEEEISRSHKSKLQSSSRPAKKKPNEVRIGEEVSMQDCLNTELIMPQEQTAVLSSSMEPLSTAAAEQVKILQEAPRISHEEEEELRRIQVITKAVSEMTPIEKRANWVYEGDSENEESEVPIRGGRQRTQLRKKEFVQVEVIDSFCKVGDDASAPKLKTGMHIDDRDSATDTEAREETLENSVVVKTKVQRKKRCVTIEQNIEVDASLEIIHALLQVDRCAPDMCALADDFAGGATSSSNGATSSSNNPDDEIL